MWITCTCLLIIIILLLFYNYVIPYTLNNLFLTKRRQTVVSIFQTIKCESKQMEHWKSLSAEKPHGVDSIHNSPASPRWFTSGDWWKLCVIEPDPCCSLNTLQEEEKFPSYADAQWLPWKINRLTLPEQIKIRPQLTILLKSGLQMRLTVERCTLQNQISFASHIPIRTTLTNTIYERG